MSNSTYAKEWIKFAYKNLVTAKLLYKCEHYTDIIGIELEQFFEKAIKSIYAYNNQKILKSHDLIELLSNLEFSKDLSEEEIDLLSIASDYYKDDRYPNPNYELPSKDEIERVLKYAEIFFNKVCKKIELNSCDFQK